MRNKILKISRVGISLVFLIFTGYLFLDFTETFSSSLINDITWIQFIPSLLKFINLAGFLALGFLVVTGVTLLFGRVYCSTVCPLGILQDVISFISRFYTTRIRKRKKRYRPAPPHNLLRYSLLGVTTVFVVFGSVFFLNLLDPFSLFGKIFSGLVRPVYYGLNNVAANVFQPFGIYTFYHVETGQVNIFSLLFPAAMLGLIGWLSFTRGRLYCNTVCPVGSFLGLLSKVAMYRIEIDDRLCTRCGKCSLNCKAQCIDLKTNEIDFSRCVGCFNCLDVCTEQGIDYQNQWFPGRKKGKADPEIKPESKPEPGSKHRSEPDSQSASKPSSKPDPVSGTAESRSGPPVETSEGFLHLSSNSFCTSSEQPVKTSETRKTIESHSGRRSFLFRLTAYFVGFSAASRVVNANTLQDSDIREDVNVEVTEPSTIPEEKSFPISPPGSLGLKHFTEACTACHLCVSACPSHVLQPSFLEYGFTGMMQPRMDYHTSFCNFDCVKCTEVCPTGAIQALTEEDKHVTQIGEVQLELDNCVVKTENTACGACAEHCPTQAVRMVPYQDGLTIPEIDVQHCVGCGACEYICPARPYRAIYVDGIEKHAEAVPPEIEELDYEEPEEDFPF